MKTRFSILVFAASCCGTLFAEKMPTTEDAVRHIVTLLRPAPGQPVEPLRDVAQRLLTAWLTKRLGQVKPARRPRVLRAILNTEFDDAAVPAHAQAIFHFDDERVHLRSEFAHHLSAYWVLRHELDHLFFYLDQPLPPRLTKMIWFCLDPRSFLWRTEKSAILGECGLRIELARAARSPDELTRATLAQLEVSEDTRSALLALLSSSAMKRGLLILDRTSDAYKSLRREQTDEDFERDLESALRGSGLGEVLRDRRYTPAATCRQNLLSMAYLPLVAQEYATKGVFWFGILNCARHLLQ